MGHRRPGARGALERLLAKALEPESPAGEAIIVDTPPNNAPMTQLAMAQADAVILPARAGGIEIDRVVATLQLVPPASPTAWSFVRP